MSVPIPVPKYIADIRCKRRLLAAPKFHAVYRPLISSYRLRLCSAVLTPSTPSTVPVPYSALFKDVITRFRWSFLMTSFTMGQRGGGNRSNRPSWAFIASGAFQRKLLSEKIGFSPKHILLEGFSQPELLFERNNFLEKNYVVRNHTLILH